mmetsp:Transcript_26425/g.61496  ORF Transcript_26425/g.61496 Transcript_26425/m.61496 type:complete len:303 (+) Transcript_26425:506-1414(+)
MRCNWPIGISFSVVIQPFAPSIRWRSSERPGVWTPATSFQNHIRDDDDDDDISSSSSCVHPSIWSSRPAEERHNTARQSPRLAMTTSSSAMVDTKAVVPDSQLRPSWTQSRQNVSSRSLMASPNTSFTCAPLLFCIPRRRNLGKDSATYRAASLPQCPSKIPNMPTFRAFSTSSRAPSYPSKALSRSEHIKKASSLELRTPHSEIAPTSQRALVQPNGSALFSFPIFEEPLCLYMESKIDPTARFGSAHPPSTTGVSGFVVVVVIAGSGFVVSGSSISNISSADDDNDDDVGATFLSIARRK